MIDVQLSGAMAREHILSELLQPLCADYDYILLDCPPSLGLMTLNGVTASSGIVIPVVAEVLPIRGLVSICNFVEMVQRRLNPSVRLLGILLTRWERTNLSRLGEEQLRSQFGSGVFEVKIHKNVKLAEAPLEGKNIVAYAPSSRGASDYGAFVDVFLSLEDKTTA